jgi:tripartite-type tricarboxylate transporter receptor subunit TctC
MPRLLLACLAALFALPAAAQTYPSRAVKIIVPFAPGASSDASARALAHALEPRLGQSVVVENNGGGGGVTGLQQMARSAPDGHTLAIGAPGAVVIVPLMPGAPAQWDPARDLLPVARLVDVPIVIVANPETGPKSLADAIAKAKSSPDGLTFGSTGTNSLMHLAVEFLSFKTGAKLVHVPYRGSAPAVTDAVAGQIPFVAVDLTSARPLIEAKKVTALAVIGPRRIAFAPQIPSLDELGYKDFQTAGFLGMFAPVGTPAPIVATLNRHVREIVASEDFKKRMHAVALEPAFLDAAGFARFLEDDRTRWRGVLKAIGKGQ